MPPASYSRVCAVIQTVAYSPQLGPMVGVCSFRFLIRQRVFLAAGAAS